MTNWNPDNQFDLGVWENLEVPPPTLEQGLDGFVPVTLPIPHSLVAKKLRKCLKLSKKQDENDDMKIGTRFCSSKSH